MRKAQPGRGRGAGAPASASQPGTLPALNSELMMQLISLSQQLSGGRDGRSPSPPPQPPHGGAAPQRAARLRQKQKRGGGNGSGSDGREEALLSGFIADNIESETEREHLAVAAAAASASVPASGVTMPMLDRNKEFINLGSGSEFSFSAFRQKCNEVDELTFLNESLRTKLRQAETEASRLSKRAATEESERKRLEIRHADVKVQFTEAKTALQETQTALHSVQQAMEQRLQKTEQRDIQIQRLASENNLLESRVYEAEAKCREVEHNFKTFVGDRDDTIRTLQEQLSNAQDNVFTIQSDLTRIKGESMLHIAELETTRRKLFALELKTKQTEHSLHLAHKQDVEELELKVSQLSNKLDVYKTQEDRLLDLQTDLRNKVTDIQQAHGMLHEAANERMDLEAKLAAAESQLQMHEMRYAQLDSKFRQQELEPAKKEAELELMRRQMRFLEETIQDQEKQASYFLKVKQEYTSTIAVQTKSLEGFADTKVKLTRQVRENERLTAQIDELHTRLHDSDRKHRLLAEDLVHAENYIAELSSKFAIYGEKDVECREALVLANERITSLYHQAKNLHTELLADRASASASSPSSKAARQQRAPEAVSMLYPAPPIVLAPHYIDHPAALLAASASAASTAVLEPALRLPVEIQSPQRQIPGIFSLMPSPPQNTASMFNLSDNDVDTTTVFPPQKSTKSSLNRIVEQPVRSAEYETAKRLVSTIMMLHNPGGDFPEQNEEGVWGSDDDDDGERLLYLYDEEDQEIQPEEPAPVEQQLLLPENEMLQSQTQPQSQTQTQSQSRSDILEQEVAPLQQSSQENEAAQIVVYRLPLPARLQSSASMELFENQTESMFTSPDTLKDPVLRCFHSVIRSTTDVHLLSSALQSSLEGQYEELAVDAVLRCTVVIGHLSRTPGEPGADVAAFMTALDPEMLLSLVGMFGHNPLFLSKAFYLLLTMCDFNLDFPQGLPSQASLLALIFKHPTDSAMLSGCFQVLLALVRCDAAVKRIAWEWNVLLEFVETLHAHEGVIKGCFDVLVEGARMYHDINARKIFELIYRQIHHDIIVSGCFAVLTALAEHKIAISFPLVCDLLVKAPTRQLIVKECLLLLFRLTELGLPIVSDQVLTLIEKFHTYSFADDLLWLLKFIAQQRRSDIHVGRLTGLLRYASVFRPPEDAALYSLLQELYDVLLILFKPRVIISTAAAAAATGTEGEAATVEELAELEALTNLVGTFNRFGGHDEVLRHLDPRVLAATEGSSVLTCKTLTVMNYLCITSESADRLGCDSNCINLAGVFRAFSSETKVVELVLQLVSRLCLESSDDQVQENMRLSGFLSSLLPSMLNNGGRMGEVLEKEFSLHCRCIINLCVRDNQANMQAFSDKVKSFCYLLRFVQREPKLLEQLVLAILAVIGHNKANHIRFLDGGVCDALHDALMDPESVSASQLVCLWALSKVAMATDKESAGVNDKIKKALRKIVQTQGVYTDDVKVSALSLLRAKFYEDAVLTLAQEKSIVQQTGETMAVLFVDAGMRNFAQKEELRRRRYDAAVKARRLEDETRRHAEAERAATEARARDAERKRQRELEEKVELERRKEKLRAAAISAAPKRLASLTVGAMLDQSVSALLERGRSPVRDSTSAASPTRAAQLAVGNILVQGIIRAASCSPPRRTFNEIQAESANGVAEASVASILSSGIRAAVASRSPSPASSPLHSPREQQYQRGTLDYAQAAVGTFIQSGLGAAISSRASPSPKAVAAASPSPSRQRSAAEAATSTLLASAVRSVVSRSPSPDRLAGREAAAAAVTPIRQHKK